MIQIRADRSRLWMVLGLLAVLHFAVRPRLGAPQVAPDFLMLALLLYAIRSRPGTAAVAGFLVGLAADAMAPSRVGAAALAHTVVGYLAAWGRAVFFPDNLFVNGLVIALGVWLRNAILLFASGSAGGNLTMALLVWAPLQAITTALTAALVLLLFQRWLDIRLEA
ncbi:MAG TPA: rod shape-determining protein MreD [Gemmatimonadales bacterium]|nr:rod shape-determining protein MreD [Gemmatimonadales bacterium]